MTPFQQRVAKAVKSIPKGQTRSYGQIAAMVGIPGGARAVIRAMGACEDLPWWRVIRSDHTIAIPMMKYGQATLLRREGVAVRGRKILPPTRAAR